MDRDAIKDLMLAALVERLRAESNEDSFKNLYVDENAFGPDEILIDGSFHKMPAMEAILAALEDAGLAIVPVRPDQGMLRRNVPGGGPVVDAGEYWFETKKAAFEFAKNIYAAMIAARPGRRPIDSEEQQ